MVGRLILYTFYKVNLFEVVNKISTPTIFTKIDFSCKITTSISKLAMDLFT